MEALTHLCNQAILFKCGHLELFEEVNTVINIYLKNMGLSSEKNWDAFNAPGNDIVRLVSVKAHNKTEKIKSNFNILESIFI